jgi:hypothetical protein
VATSLVTLSGDGHMYWVLSSLAVKGLTLEPAIGTEQYAKILLGLAVLSSAMYVIVSFLTGIDFYECQPGPDTLLFALKPVSLAMGVGDRENKIKGSGCSLEPPGLLLTHLHTVYMACSECLRTRLNPLAEGLFLPGGRVAGALRHAAARRPARGLDRAAGRLHVPPRRLPSGPSGAFKRPSRFPMQIGFLWRCCMDAQGA